VSQNSEAELSARFKKKSKYLFFFISFFFFFTLKSATLIRIRIKSDKNTFYESKRNFGSVKCVGDLWFLIDFDWRAVLIDEFSQIYRFKPIVLFHVWLQVFISNDVCIVFINIHYTVLIIIQLIQIHSDVVYFIEFA